MEEKLNILPDASVSCGRGTSQSARRPDPGGMLMIHTSKISDPTLRLRMEWANSAAYALGECHPDEAVPLCVAFLESVETRGPTLGNFFGWVISDASLWAAAAPLHELVAYGLAALKRFPSNHLTKLTLKKVLMALWRSLNDEEQAAFIQTVTKGRAHG
ncbi:hypothetical protein [Roseinatronobacter monicus]|uniref:Uncharacterized protein n=1 Tax=Roseinatronobacter monicus TaxID=393481 RepID=A0A543KBJ3_9RHOB|nr:hypothetical protein [Roseinatronobacter monicus]TQM92445.1 hypothetical protein BD293_1052 [Roseinatronobacter monicus]